MKEIGCIDMLLERKEEEKIDIYLAFFNLWLFISHDKHICIIKVKKCYLFVERRSTQKAILTCGHSFKICKKGLEMTCGALQIAENI